MLREYSISAELTRGGTCPEREMIAAATGEVIQRAALTASQHLQFLRTIGTKVPTELDVHLIMDNYGTDKRQKELSPKGRERAVLC